MTISEGPAPAGSRADHAGAALAGRLTPSGHELLQRVYFEDTDFSGAVYHARYLHFMERGRSDYLRLLGFHHLELQAEGLGFAVARLQIDYLRPARMDDVLRILTTPMDCSGARLNLQQSVLRGDELLARGAVWVALIGAGGRPQRLPMELRRAFTPPASA